MASDITLTKEELEREGGRLYYHVHCKQLEGLRIELTNIGQEHKSSFSILGLSSTETIRTGMKAVDVSPFKTVFVWEEASGKVLFALSKNEEYVKAARRKDPRPPPDNPPPPISACCQICSSMGGYACDALSDGSCICYGADRADGGGANLDDALGTLAV